MLSKSLRDKFTDSSIRKGSPDLQFYRLVVIKELLYELHLKHQSEIVFIFFRCSLLAVAETGYPDEEKITYSLALDVWHKVEKLVESHGCRKLLACIVDGGRAVKKHLLVVFLYQRYEYVLTFIHHRLLLRHFTIFLPINILVHHSVVSNTIECILIEEIKEVDLVILTFRVCGPLFSLFQSFTIKSPVHYLVPNRTS